MTNPVMTIEGSKIPTPEDLDYMLYLDSLYDIPRYGMLLFKGDPPLFRAGCVAWAATPPQDRSRDVMQERCLRDELAFEWMLGDKQTHICSCWFRGQILATVRDLDFGSRVPYGTFKRVTEEKLAREAITKILSEKGAAKEDPKEPAQHPDLVFEWVADFTRSDEIRKTYRCLCWLGDKLLVTFSGADFRDQKPCGTLKESVEALLARQAMSEALPKEKFKPPCGGLPKGKRF